MSLRKTKIVATLGPASSSEEMLTELIKAGVNVCRLNFSHGTHEDHQKAIENVRIVNKKLGSQCAILADLQGPKLRVGKIENGAVELINGSELIITTEKVVGTAKKVYVSYDKFPQDVQKGERVLMDDGKLALEVVSSDKEKEVITKVIHGGILKPNKGVNLPKTKISLPSLTEKDIEDLNFVLQFDIDWIALSFVRSAKDLIELKLLISHKKKHTRVVAKIEKPEAIEDLDNILKETDAVMVARGDLGVEMPMQKIPMLQKDIIKRCMRNAKPVIVATQMMESMITNVTPTRAEVNDVANAVMDGADAVMLSGETSVGEFPVEVIEAMGKIIKEVEKYDGLYNHEILPKVPDEARFITDSICYNSCRLSNTSNAKAIITMTFSGYTAFKTSSQRPKADIFVFTGNRELLSSLSLVWGVRAFYYDKFISTDDTITDIKTILLNKKLVKKKDLVINIASMPITDKGMSNMLKLSQV